MIGKNEKIIAALAASCGLGLCIAFALHSIRRHDESPNLVYTAEGYGGYVPAKPRVPKAENAGTKAAIPHALFVAYNAGHYAQVKRAAKETIAKGESAPDVTDRERAVQARLLLAYADARQKDLRSARDQFAVLQHEAATLPDKGKELAPAGEVAPTVEAEAAYEHAVCTGALGNKEVALSEYTSFMKHFPDSPLINATAWRITRMYHGDMPAEAQKVWQQAKKTALSDAEQEARKQALCGPECLSELLRRKGETVAVLTLADEADTTGEGTSMQGLASAAARYHFTLTGLALTEKGLFKQPMPLIALMRTGHYVIVESASTSGVDIWDPDAHGTGHAAKTTIPTPQWLPLWQGSVLRPAS